MQTITMAESTSMAQTLSLAGVALSDRDGEAVFIADDREFALAPVHFKLVVPKGGLKGYESH